MINILGIRHHGMGSARRVRERLDELQPDLILIEGPPEISEMLGMIGVEGLQPPVALMIYNEKNPKQSTFYPFAKFSPEWVAAKYANENGIPVRAMDLPAAISFKKQDLERETSQAEKEVSEVDIDETSTEAILQQVKVSKRDPLSYLAEIAGFRDGEAWWEYQFETNQSSNAEDHFKAVQLTMQALREEGVESSLDEENIDREIYMRH
ncbi:MAG: DUF5682 family protein, partial [Bacteroidota bacterium]